MVNGLILAAGRGSRMGGKTDDRPKCLNTIAGKVLIEWQISALAEAGIEAVHIVAGYRHHMLKPYADRMWLNRRWNETNMVASLACASEALKSATTVVSYSDILYHPSCVSALLASTSDVSITFDRRWESLWSARFDDPLSDAETFKVDGSRLVAIGQQPEEIGAVEGQYMGLLKFSPAGWSRIDDLLRSELPETVAKLDMTSLLQKLLSSGTTVTAVPVDGRWCEVDSENDLELYEDMMARHSRNSSRWEHDWRW